MSYFYLQRTLFLSYHRNSRHNKSKDTNTTICMNKDTNNNIHDIHISNAVTEVAKKLLSIDSRNLYQIEYILQSTF